MPIDSAGLLALMLAAGFAAGYVWRGTRRDHSAVHSALPAPAATDSTARLQAANEERLRIYRDLHDDIGAKMLTLIHTLDNETHADLARAVMQDLRDIVSRSARADGSLLDILAQIRDETEQRLEALDVLLHWEQDTALPDPHLDDGQALHLFRIVREAVTNSLRHAHPRSIRIRCQPLSEDLVLDITDDGPGPRPEQRGAGTSAMRRRAEELQGSIHWNPGTEGGTKVLLRFPLPAAT